MYNNLLAHVLCTTTYRAQARPVPPTPQYKAIDQNLQLPGCLSMLNAVISSQTKHSHAYVCVIITAKSGLELCYCSWSLHATW